MTVTQALLAAKKLSEKGFDVNVRISHRKNRRSGLVNPTGPEVLAEVSVPIHDYDDLDHLTKKRDELRDLGYNAKWDGSSEFDLTQKS